MKARIGNAIGPYEDLLTTVKRRKLKWYGHVTRSSRLAKTILQGTVQGGRRRGRQRKRWEDNIKEWTGLPWNITLRKAENREEWRKLVVKSTVVPNGQPDYGIDKIREEIRHYGKRQKTAAWVTHHQACSGGIRRSVPEKRRGSRC